MAPGKRAPSKHSRASRRATSPSINTDKSLKAVSLPTARDDNKSTATTTTQPSVLAARHSAGVTKRAKAGRKSRPSAKAKRRHEKGLEMAEAVLERTGKKIEKSAGRARAVRARSKAWDDINKIVGEDNGEADADVPAAKKKNLKGGPLEESEDGTDEEMDGDEMAEGEALASNRRDQAVDDDGDEEIL